MGDSFSLRFGSLILVEKILPLIILSSNSRDIDSLFFARVFEPITSGENSLLLIVGGGIFSSSTLAIFDI